MGYHPQVRMHTRCNHDTEKSGCWGILELQWNGAKLIDVETMLGWAKKMTWKGIHPVVELSRKVYEKGIALSKAAMQAAESPLERDPQFSKQRNFVYPGVPPLRGKT